MSGRFTKIMMAQLKKAHKTDHPNLIPLIDEADVKTWHFLVCNLPDPYVGGEFIIKLVAPGEFPHKPPSFSVLTPNGVFETGGKICLSIGEFHANDHKKSGERGAYGWRSALGMIGFAREVVNAFIVPDSLGGGIRIIRNRSDKKTRQLSAASRQFNTARRRAIAARFESILSDPQLGQLTAARRLAMWRSADELKEDSKRVSAALGPELEALAPWFASGPGPLGLVALRCRDVSIRAILATIAACAAASPADRPAAHSHLVGALREFCADRDKDLVEVVAATRPADTAAAADDLFEFVRAPRTVAREAAKSRLIAASAAAPSAPVENAAEPGEFAELDQIIAELGLI